MAPLLRARCALLLCMAAAAAALGTNSTCTASMKASKGTTPTANTCTSCYTGGDKCCPTLTTFFGVDIVECSSSSSSLVKCAPSSTDKCGMVSWRLWTAILVPIGFLILLCVAGCLYCCFKKPKVVANTTIIERDDDRGGGEADAGGDIVKARVAPRRGVYVQLKV